MPDFKTPATTEQAERLTTFIGQYITENRKATIEKVLDQRTRRITLVLENIYQSQNASAAVRTCECLGIQDIHIIESSAKYSVNKKVLMGSYKWMNLIRYKGGANNTADCYQELRRNGYTILATDPSPGGTSLLDVDLGSKLAIVMGNELKGISDYALKHADGQIWIPMFGFTESMNISVSAAICLQSLATRLRQTEGWKLSAEEQSSLRLDWYRKCVKRPEILERAFWSRPENKD